MQEMFNLHNILEKLGIPRSEKHSDLLSQLSVELK